jgi:uncharacterized repeat protein (TIGR01451 family)
MKKILIFATFIPTFVFLPLLFLHFQTSTISLAKNPVGIGTNLPERVGNALALSGNTMPERQYDSEINAVDAESDLAVIKTGPPDPVYTRDLLTYTIVVSNSGPRHDNDVVLTDTLPSSVTLVDLDTTQGDCTGGETIVCNLGKVLFNKTYTVTIVVSADEIGVITNTAIVKGINDDFNTDNNTSSVTNNVYQSVDLSMSKTVSAGPYYIGQPLTYTLVVTNTDPYTATLVTLTDSLPDEVDFVSVTPTEACSETDRVVTCGFGDLTDGETASATIVVTPNTNGIVTNTADVTATTYDPNLDDNTDSITITAGPIADLSLTKIGESDTVYAGEPLTYTLTVVNNGPSASLGVILTDILPENVTLISANSTQGPCDDPVAGQVTCNLNTIGSGGSETVTIVVIPGDVDNLNNQALVSADTYDPIPANNSDTADTTVLDSADIALTKSGEPTLVYTGDPLTYTITVTNNGPSTASGVVLTDTLPGNITFVSVNTTQGFCADPYLGDVVCNLEDILSDQTVTVTIVVTVTVNGEYTNYAQVSTTTHDPNTENNADTLVTSVEDFTDLALTKTGEPDIVYVGELLTYTLTVVNNGSYDASGVILTDTLPGNVTVVFIGTNQGSCIGPQLGNVVCNLGVISMGGVATVTIVVSSEDGEDLSNHAMVTAATGDPFPENNFDTLNTVVLDSADLTLNKIVESETVYAGEPLTYTLTVVNNGPSAASGVILTDILPGNVTLISANSTQGICDDPVAGQVVCNLDTIGSGGSETVTIVVIPGDVDNLNNQALVSADTHDPVPANNSDTADTTVLESADIALTKSGEPTLVYAGESLTYTLTVVNSGPSTASGVVLTDTLPGNITFVSVNTTQGLCADPYLGDVVCNLEDILSDQTVTVTIVVTVMVNDEYTNYAQVSTTTRDPNTENNFDTHFTSLEDLADLSLTKTGEPDYVYAGESLEYTLAVTNNGPYDASGVILTDTLPLNVAFGSYSATQGVCENLVSGDVVCELGTIPSDSTVDVTLWVTATLGGTLDNTAVVNSGTFDPYPDNNTATESTIVIPTADLAVIKDENQDPAYYLHPFSYTVTVINNGPDTATNVEISDDLPESLLFGSATLPGGSCIGTSSITCTLAELVSGASVDLTIFVTPTVNGIIENDAWASSDLVDLHPANNSDSETTSIVPEADLAVNKFGDPGVLMAGENLTYTITAVNNGPSIATDVTVIDSLPTGLDIVSIDPSQGSCTENGDVNCELGNLFLDDTVTITIETTVAVDGVITNTVSISSDVADLTTGNNTAQAETIVNPVAELSLTQTDQPDPVWAQAILEYVVTIHNDGPSDTQNVHLEDTLDPGVTYLSVSPSEVECTLVGQVLDCLLGTVMDDQTLVVTITTRTKQSTVGTITNTVVITSDTFDPVLGNNTSVVTTTLPPDNSPPTVSWNEPTGKGGTTHVGGETIRLEAIASDDRAVDYVLFKFWDYIALRWREIGRDYTEPYQWDFNTFVLNPGDNQVNVESYDTAGNKAPPHGVQEYIWLVYTPPPYILYVPLVLR